MIPSPKLQADGPNLGLRAREKRVGQALTSYRCGPSAQRTSCGAALTLLNRSAGWTAGWITFARGAKKRLSKGHFGGKTLRGTHQRSEGRCGQNEESDPAWPMDSQPPPPSPIALSSSHHHHPHHHRTTSITTSSAVLPSDCRGPSPISLIVHSGDSLCRAWRGCSL